MRLLILLIILCTPTIASANDSEYGNHAGTPAPVENTDVRMVSEDIVIEEQGSGFWKVDATYVFENTSKKATTLTMGFPELQGDPGKPFLKFKTSVDGKPVKVQAKKSAPVARALPKGAKLGRVHLFDATLDAGASVGTFGWEHIHPGRTEWRASMGWSDAWWGSSSTTTSRRRCSRCETSST